MLLGAHFVDAYEVLLLFGVKHTLESLKNHFLLGINLLFLLPHQNLVQETLLIALFGLLEFGLEFILKSIFILVTYALLISLFIDLTIEIYDTIILQFWFNNRYKLVICLFIWILFLISNTFLCNHFKVSCNLLIGIFFLMLSEKMADITLIKVAKVASLLNYLGETLNNKINKLTLIICHVVLLYDYILR